MWGKANENSYVERTLGDIKEAVVPLTKAVTALEAQTKNISESLERAFKAIDDTNRRNEAMSATLQAELSAGQKDTKHQIEIVEKRVDTIEATIQESRGSFNTVKWLSATFGAALFGLLISGGIWLHNEAYDSRERITVIERTLENVDKPTQQYMPPPPDVRHRK